MVVRATEFVAGPGWQGWNFLQISSLVTNLLDS
jgi:hypothetical protein